VLFKLKTLRRRPAAKNISRDAVDVLSATAGLMQRVSEQHVRRGDLVDDRKIDILAPELREPAADDDLVVFFLAHWNGSFVNCLGADHRH
jgi:hypothetical protein